MTPSTITIGIDPTIDLGPVSIAWHGLTIALGIGIGGLVAGMEARRRGLPPEPLQTMGLILVLSAIVGSKAFYLAEHGGLTSPEAWISSRGFTFYGGFILAALCLVYFVRARRLSLEYLDAVAFGLALGYAIGRVGDIINGEHYGPPTSFFLGVRNSHPEADVPDGSVAYHNGGLYEMLIGSVTFVIAALLLRRLRPVPTATVWLVMALLAIGRFVEFFVRSDSATGWLGLETAQWTSLAIILLAAVGAVWAVRRARATMGSPQL